MRSIYLICITVLHFFKKSDIIDKLPVYATGGLASAIIGYCKHDIKPDVDMVLKGLYIIYKITYELNLIRRTTVNINSVVLNSVVPITGGYA
jgi:hypothetical protein